MIVRAKNSKGETFVECVCPEWLSARLVAEWQRQLPDLTVTADKR